MKCVKGLIYILLLGVVISCKKDSEEFVPNYEHEYINTAIGSYIIYQVDSTVYNDFDATVRTNSVQFKEVVTEDFLDNLNRTAQRIARFERNSDEEEWVETRSYYIVKEKTTLEKIEENLRFISFIFPPKVDQTWKGNQYIQPVDNNKYLADWTYKFTSVNQAATVLGKTYAETATILLRDRETAIEKVFAKEIYAKNVGLVYKEWWHLETQNISDLPWTEKAQKGYIIKMQAIEHGVE